MAAWAQKRLIDEFVFAFCESNTSTPILDFDVSFLFGFNTSCSRNGLGSNHPR